MAVIIYGTRAYGRVDAYGGQHAQTTFFHIWYVPLIPTGSHWITRADNDAPVGHEIAMHGKSVLAGWLRVWGALIGVPCLFYGVAGHLGALVVGAIALALCAWSWTWLGLRGEAARRRSDFNLLAFGTRCEPHRMLPALRDAVKRDLDDTWGSLQPDRSPNDIAQHGTKDAHQAIVAYGLLRLAGVTRGKAGRDDDTDADRILAGAHETLAVGEGPYRGTQDAPLTGSLATIVSEMAHAQERMLEQSPAHRARRLAEQKRKSRRHAVYLALATPLALGGVALAIDNLKAPVTPTIQQLRGIHPPVGRTVQITCDALEGPVWEETDRHHNPEHRISICAYGGYAVPVRYDADDAAPTKTVVGKLREVDDKVLWVREGLRADKELDAHALDVFVDIKDQDERIITACFAFAFALGVPLLWVLWFRARRRRKAAESAT